jgi:hypothetical protein
MDVGLFRDNLDDRHMGQDAYGRHGAKGFLSWRYRGPRDFSLFYEIAQERATRHVHLGLETGLCRLDKQFWGILLHGHFCALKEIWGKHTQEAMKEALNLWFSMKHPQTGKHFFETIIGIIPEDNDLGAKAVCRSRN